MNNYEPKPNTIVLFNNEQKSSDTQPDVRGKLVLPDGTEQSVSIWIKTSKAGKRYLSGNFSDPYNPEEKETPKETPKADPVSAGASLPF